MTFQLKMTEQQVVDGLRSTFGNEFVTADVRGFCAANDIGYSTVTKKLKKYKVSKGKWNLEVTTKVVEDIEKSFNAPAVRPVVDRNLIPETDDTFVKFGSFTDVKKIIQSNLFYPTFITGLSGNGKTFSVEQACAQLKRELIRVNITIETDEDDLIGGFRLVDGSTVWHNGPVIEALERGAILLLDEIDLASNKILCLQSILEGNGVFLKKIGKFVKPAAGFTHLPIFFRNTPFPSSMDWRQRILLEAKSISSSNKIAPRSSASMTGPLCKTVAPSTRRNPPIRSSSSVSIVMFTRISSLLREAHACSTPKVLPFPERPVIKVG